MGQAHVERQHLGHGQHEEFITLHEPPHPVVQLRALDLGVANRLRGQPHAAVDLPQNRLLHEMTMPGDDRAEAGDERQRPQRLEHLVDIGEIRLGVFHNAPERFKHVTLRIHRLCDARVDRELKTVAPRVRMPRPLSC